MTTDEALKKHNCAVIHDQFQMSSNTDIRKLLADLPDSPLRHRLKQLSFGAVYGGGIGKVGELANLKSWSK